LAVRRFRQDPHMLVAAHVLGHCNAWLERRALAPRTGSAQERWVSELVERLPASNDFNGFVAASCEDDRRAVMDDWRRLIDRRLAAADGQPRAGLRRRRCWARGHARPDVQRVEVDPKAPRAVSREQLRVAA
jgi:hypothetical protein